MQVFHNTKERYYLSLIEFSKRLNMSLPDSNSKHTLELRKNQLERRDEEEFKEIMHFYGRAIILFFLLVTKGSQTEKAY